jgi:hypothetical protein
MYDRLLKSFAALTVCCLMLALASPGLAQWRDRYGQDRYGDGRMNVGWLIRQAENRSDQFATTLERTRGRGLFERVFNREDGLTARARDLENQLNLVRQEFYRSGTSGELRSQIASALSVGQNINNAMRYRRVDYGAERQWMLLRSDLNRLARAFDLAQIT